MAPLPTSLFKAKRKKIDQVVVKRKGCITGLRVKHSRGKEIKKGCLTAYLYH
jgi:hypothetical protein